MHIGNNSSKFKEDIQISHGCLRNDLLNDTILSAKGFNLCTGTLGNKFRWKLKKNTNMFIDQNTFGNALRKIAAIVSRPQCSIINCLDTEHSLILAPFNRSFEQKWLTWIVIVHIYLDNYLLLFSIGSIAIQVDWTVDVGWVVVDISIKCNVAYGVVCSSVEFRSSW